MFEEIGRKIDNAIYDMLDSFRSWNYKRLWFKIYNYINGRRLIEESKQNIDELELIKKSIVIASRNDGLTKGQSNKLMALVDQHTQQLSALN